MKYRYLPLLVSILLLVVAVTPTLVISASWQSQETWTLSTITPTYTNLTITPGTGSAWVDGGYDFAGTAIATSAGLRPLHNVRALSLVLWVSPKTVASGVRYLVNQYRASGRVLLFQNANNFTFSFGNSSVTDLRGGMMLEAGKVYCVIARWSADENEGKMDLFINNTKTTSTTKYVTNTTADYDLYLSSYHGSTLKFNGSVYSLAIYTRRITDMEVAASSQSRDVVLGNVANYYTINEGTGVVIQDRQTTWRYQDSLSVNVVGAVAYQPVWRWQDQWNVTLWNQTVTVIEDLTEVVNMLLPLAGMVVTILGPCLLVAAGKKRDPMMILFALMVTVIGVGLWWGALL